MTRTSRSIGITAGVLALSALVTGCSSSWKAQVVSADEDQVCTVSFQGERDSFNQPVCVGRSSEELLGGTQDVRVGECVIAGVHHPVAVIEGRADCPAGGQLKPTTSTIATGPAAPTTR